MIFVTVGTHEQQFNRLVACVDNLKKDGVIQEEVIIQTGFSTYEPQFCKYSKLFPYQKMIEFVRDAHIVITHGGPSSFIMPLQEGKIPIVVPRQKQFEEHVNDHQLEFVKKISESGNIIPVYDISKLSDVLKRYDSMTEKGCRIFSNNEHFNQQLAKIVDDLMN